MRQDAAVQVPESGQKAEVVPETEMKALPANESGTVAVTVPSDRANEQIEMAELKTSSMGLR